MTAVLNNLVCVKREYLSPDVHQGIRIQSELLRARLHQLGNPFLDVVLFDQRIARVLANVRHLGRLNNIEVAHIGPYKLLFL